MSSKYVIKNKLEDIKNSMYAELNRLRLQLLNESSGHEEPCIHNKTASFGTDNGTLAKDRAQKRQRALRYIEHITKQRVYKHKF